MKQIILIKVRYLLSIFPKMCACLSACIPLSQNCYNSYYHCVRERFSVAPSVWQSDEETLLRLSSKIRGPTHTQTHRHTDTHTLTHRGEVQMAVSDGGLDPITQKRTWVGGGLTQVKPTEDNSLSLSFTLSHNSLRSHL